MSSAFEIVTEDIIDQTNALTTVSEQWMTTLEENLPDGAADENLGSAFWMGIAFSALVPIVLGGNCLVITAFAIDK